MGNPIQGIIASLRHSGVSWYLQMDFAVCTGLNKSDFVLKPYFMTWFFIVPDARELQIKFAIISIQTKGKLICILLASNSSSLHSFWGSPGAEKADA